MMISPYNIHIGEWVYGHHTEGSDDRTNGQDIYYPVCIDSINNDTVETTDGETYNFEQLSPIPFNQEGVKLFNWSDIQNGLSDVVSLHRNWQTGELFFRFTLGTRRMHEKHGLTCIHEAQQWYFKTFRKPLILTLVNP